jgi:hypothetical protein
MSKAILFLLISVIPFVCWVFLQVVQLGDPVHGSDNFLESLSLFVWLLLIGLAICIQFKLMADSKKSLKNKNSLSFFLIVIIYLLFAFFVNS